MTSAFRRFEILLPLRFNDGKAVPVDLIAETLLEIEQRFGAVSSETQTIQGLWSHQGRSYRDDLARIFVDVPDTPETIAYFRGLKDKLKLRFEQIDIWMTSHSIEIL